MSDGKASEAAAPELIVRKPQLNLVFHERCSLANRAETGRLTVHAWLQRERPAQACCVLKNEHGKAPVCCRSLRPYQLSSYVTRPPKLRRRASHRRSSARASGNSRARRISPRELTNSIHLGVPNTTASQVWLRCTSEGLWIGNSAARPSVLTGSMSQLASR